MRWKHTAVRRSEYIRSRGLHFFSCLVKSVSVSVTVLRLKQTINNWLVTPEAGAGAGPAGAESGAAGGRAVVPPV